MNTWDDVSHDSNYGVLFNKELFKHPVIYGFPNGGVAKTKLISCLNISQQVVNCFLILT